MVIDYTFYTAFMFGTLTLNESANLMAELLISFPLEVENDQQRELISNNYSTSNSVPDVMVCFPVHYFSTKY